MRGVVPADRRSGKGQAVRDKRVFIHHRNRLLDPGERPVYDASMTAPPPDRSRDRRIEDATNLWIVHPLARRALPWCLRHHVSANAVSFAGLAVGALAALSFSRWDHGVTVIAGLMLAVAWLVADGLDGMVARATGTASALGRALDGMCDHGVFALIYVGLALSIGSAEGWALAVGAGVAHAVQSNLYESERARFHRRSRGLARVEPAPSRNPLVVLYDKVAAMLDRSAARLDAVLDVQGADRALARSYADSAVAPMRLMSLLSANMRVLAIFVACLAREPQLFWWFELIVLTAILVSGLVWHRAVEARLLTNANGDPQASARQVISRRT